MMKEKNGENKRLEKIGWMMKYYIWLQGEMKLEFVKNARKQSKFQFTWNRSCTCFDKPLFWNEFFIKDLILYFSDLKLEWSDKFFETKVPRKKTIIHALP
jgi:hypothetical protein